MTEERQVTVAELLARAGATETDRPRRRRRRSLEDGGISVAELTGSLPKVEATPVDSRHTAQPLEAENADRVSRSSAEAAPAPAPAEAAPAPAPAEAAPAAPAAPVPAEPPASEPAAKPYFTDSTAVIAAVPDELAPEPEQQLPPVLSPPETVVLEASDNEITGQIDVVADIDPAGDIENLEDLDIPGLPAVDSVEFLETDEDEEAEEEGGSFATGPVILMALVGIVIGAVVFVGFHYLWASGLANLVVGVLALAVTGMYIGLAHALRTTRDTLSMVLAGIVGLLMTFGPGVVVLL
ncbi:hypothetical protein [Corynebacterium caspium]|uniref:hypothetical protein n=1 Tax=Corynebacterium caspium TaxID=234828 RepID=UPI000372EA72|nr:hypothetical protein [Corynebacterium caspium]WKD59915.1 hypothetical protein CCASP_07700 [Corynebacterium caspium DSM 44850]